jgi:RNA polymerase sigma-70 factor (ECF subfamily)
VPVTDPFRNSTDTLMEETKHWESLKAGNIKALEALYNDHIGALYSYGMVLCQDADKVKDCIQDLFLTFWNNRDGLTIPTSGKAYLMVSLRRRLFDKGPKSNLQTIPMEDADMDEGMFSDPEENWIRAEEEEEGQKKLELAMGRLSERQKEIIHMKYYQQMDYEDIAAVMDLNYQSARNLVNRAIMALRREMITVLGIILLLM